MRAEAWAHGWAALLGAVLLSTGCVTLDPAADLASSDEAPADVSCGGRSVPAGWPDFSSHDSAALLAPFLTCSSPAEYVALQVQSHFRESGQVSVQRVRLVYEGGELKPTRAADLKAALEETKSMVPGVEVLFQ
ncbi:hypothetical protein D187_007922 [Cystobacter fuscus DSM 2262]|uniref:Lipoprotein n=1 Tax=Cystobacter fuscus (strain ATCC 25194 / DSM 2262 / NBRC 100088 / M29) TaxID=1242864 RepID=S9NWL9_CYSF2|nr:hypothetical protein [Cystobacter fuscus]EPX56580.1 hypothetical protein D187_007922 [Cystobacter fuscus DSM 2262]